MARQALAFSSNEQRSLPLDAARLLNLFPEQPPLGARAPALQVGISSPLKSVLYGTPGLKPSLAIPPTPKSCRAARQALGYLWALFGSDLHRVDAAGNVVTCSGALISAEGPAMMSDNGIQLSVLSNKETFVVGAATAKFTFQVTGGTYAAGTNKITAMLVDSVSIIGGAVDWTGSNAGAARAIAKAVNDHTSSPDYTATVTGDKVTIAAADAGPDPNGFAVSITTGGDVTLSATAGELTGGAAVSTEVIKVESDGYPEEGADSIDYMDGYTIWNRSGTKQFFLSGLYDTTSIDPLDFASAESTPATLLRAFVDHRELWLFKAQGIEVWANTGASPFPFERIPGAVLEKGCAAGLTVAKADSSVFWLGDDLVVYRATGYQPARISTHGMEDEIGAFATVADAHAFTYTQGGHVFYVLTFPTAGRTFVYDSITQGWHDRQSGTSIDPAAWKVTCVTAAFGKLWAGFTLGRLCELDMDTYSEAGEPIRRAVRTAPLFADGKEFILNEVEVECELGVGASTGQGSDPQIMLRWSNDGCASWSNERSGSMGRRGVRGNRVIFRRLGRSRQRTLEFSISDPVKVALYGMRFEPEGLES